MLFSQPELASFLEEHFECAWESVRSVPRLDIDFGDGKRLTRTLNGNVATWICTAEGGALDLVPGLVDPSEYRVRLESALSLHDAVLHLPPDAGARLVAAFHRGSAEILALPASDQPGALESRRAEAEQEADLCKMLVESELKHALADIWSAELARHSRRAPAGAAAADALALDTRYNREHRYPLAHALLAEHPLAPAQSMTLAAYRDILHVDLDDPWLGLAPLVLGGEGGRSG